MKSKAIVLILGESLNDQGEVGFFVSTLEMPFFGPSIWPLLLKVPELGPQKKGTFSAGTKIRDLGATWTLHGHWALLGQYFGTTYMLLWHYLAYTLALTLAWQSIRNYHRQPEITKKIPESTGKNKKVQKVSEITGQNRKER